jgi:cytochrome b
MSPATGPPCRSSDVHGRRAKAVGRNPLGPVTNKALVTSVFGLGVTGILGVVESAEQVRGPADRTGH